MKPPPRGLDCLRALSPLSRNAGMPTRGIQAHTQRHNGLVNGNAPKKPHTSAPSRTLDLKTSNGPAPSSKAPQTSRPLRSSNPRLTKPQITGVSASPRKTSAPAKLINAIGSTLEDHVTLRRKVSTPTRGSNPAPSGASQFPATKVSTKRASSAVATHPTISKKKVPSGTNQEYNPLQRISKDHTSTSQTSAGGKGTAGAASSAPEGSKAPKKGAQGLPDDVHSLPTLQEEEEKKPKTKAKMASLEEETPWRLPGGEEAPPPEGGSVPAVDDLVEEGKGLPLQKPPNLERMVSDLIKNNESKKQEIAVLKMEINRLKEAAKEKHDPPPAPMQEDPHHSNESAAASKEKQENSSRPQEGKAEEAGKGSSSVRPEDDEEVNRLQSVVESLATDNRFLRDHLRHLGVSLDSSPLSDQQKEMVLSRVSAFPQSGDTDKDWDAKSSSSISEVSVACLQGRIQQMEETHYSTNEELQATLQELEDLREHLSECQIEVQQLQEEKQVILESLTQQTEKLNEARGHNDTLKSMLIQQSENSQDMSQCERTQRLMELLKSLQEDKELVQLKQEEFEQQMHASKEAEEHFHREAQLIRDRMKLLESMVEAATNEKRKAETQLFEAQELMKASEREVSRLKASLSTAKEKITELEATVISGEKSELADVLERVCSEKEASEKEVSNLQRKVNDLMAENDRLKDQVSGLQESLRVTRNNAKTNLDDVEWRRTQLDEQRRKLELEAETLQAAAAEAQLACQRHLEDKRELKASLSEAQKKLAEALERQTDLERGFREEKAAFARQVEEWDQFQKDLLTSVRVANDFKTEAQRTLERTEQENLLLKERLRILDLDLEKAKAASSKLPSPTGSGGLNGSAALNPLGAAVTERRLYKGVFTNGDSILGDRRINPRPLARGDSRVKSLIESIECATKATKAGSRSSSTSSLASSGSENNNNNNNNNNNVKAQLRRADTEGMIRNLPSSLSPISPLKESLTNTSPSPLRPLHCNSLPDSLPTSYSNKPQSTNLPDTVKMSQLSSEKNNSRFGSGFPPSSCLGDSKPVSSILGSKVEPIRRNSYNQISLLEKKDPLASLSQAGGSKRNALLKWCQNKTSGYKGVDITNFSSSWNDGLAFCALLDTYMPEKINYASLNVADKRRNFEVAFNAAESVGIPTILDINDMITLERPTWQSVFNYVTSIYSHFET